MITKEILLKEIIKNGYYKENGARVWSIANRSFRYINPEMAKSYLKLKEHPRYKATIIDIEIKLLKENIQTFLKSLNGKEFNLIVNCEDGTKAKAIISSLPKNMKIRYCPISVNEYLINLSLENVKKENFTNVIDYAPRITIDLESLDDVGAALRNSKYQKNVLFLHGSFLASFDINDYLFRLSQSMLPGDMLIIGNGIRTGERFANLETYKHPIFNEWLIHLMKYLGFQDKEVEYNARFANNRLEAYYTIKVDREIKYEKKEIDLKKGDKIIVLFQYKLFENELKDFCNMYFDNVKIVTDQEKEYAVVLCER